MCSALTWPNFLLAPQCFYAQVCELLSMSHLFSRNKGVSLRIDCVWNVMAHEQKPDFFFRRNGRVHLNRRGRQFSRLLAAEVCASAVVMLDTPCYEVVWRVLANNSIWQFPHHFPSRASPCAITFQLDSTSRRVRPEPVNRWPTAMLAMQPANSSVQLCQEPCKFMDITFFCKF